MENIQKSEAREVFELFQELNKVPRPSGDMQRVSDHLVEFAKKHNLDYTQDKSLNVIIRKPGTKGYENADTIVLQGHMDMVPEKEADSNHDFSKDPIAFIVDGDFVHADKTTLGADNGIAVAFALAILASDDIPHPPLEVLITTDEETGMYGAIDLDVNDIKGRKLLNIDTEVEGQLLVSCSGGISSHVTLPIQRAAKTKDTVKAVLVDGLLGGHSGMEIHKQRGNASQILARVLNNIGKEIDFELASIEGGSKHNAIPREAKAVIAINSSDVAKFEGQLAEWKKILKQELRGIDDGVNLSLTDESAEKVMSKDSKEKTLTITNLMPIGVHNVSFDIEGLVQTSSNLGVLKTLDDKVTFETSVRSSVQTMRDEITDKIELLAKVNGAEMTLDSGYPAWQYDPNSQLKEVFIKTYKEQYGDEPEVTAIHAGLECGILSEKFGGKIDQISFGPDLFDVHTPKEKMKISSVERTYKLLKNLLANLK